MSHLIPLYGADGSFDQMVTPERMNQLVALDRVRVVKNRKGLVKRLMQRATAPELPRTAYMGTAYSHRQHLESGHVVWTLKRLGRGDELRPVFLKVVTDCLLNP